jgi:hypothetical protein
MIRFSTTGKSSVSGFGRAKRAIDKAILEALKTKASACSDDPHAVETPPHWALHDLRRTVATNSRRVGVKLEVTQAVLNHV